MTRRDWSRCPDPETLAAFAAGTLRGTELKMTAEHLNECEECPIVVGEAVRAGRETSSPAIAMGSHAGTSRRFLPWWLAAAAAALIGIAYLTMVPTAPSTSPMVRELVDAMPRESRYVEPRLTGGFPWAPLRTVRRDPDAPLDPAQMRVVGAAGAVLEKRKSDNSVDARHAVAIAHLLAGRADEANQLLTSVAETKQDAQLWSDLAAARYIAASQTDDDALLAGALAAADHALQIDPHLPEALFNRALIIQHLGIRQQAREAWERYLAVDRVSDWAREAQRHLHALTAPVVFRDELKRRYNLMIRDSNEARALARQFPQDARTWGETEILARWAQAEKEGNSSALMHLSVARAFGDELADAHGDRMLKSAVAAIDAAEPGRRQILATGHLQFRQAQSVYGAGRAAEAQRLFREAASAFGRGGSPASLLAQYFEANTLFDQGHVDESRALLASLLAAAPPQFPAYRAQLEWEMGLVLASYGRWGHSIDVLSDSIDTFERLGEIRYATSVREILAEVYDRIGDLRSGWRHRIAVLQELGRSENPKLLVTLDAAARAAALDQNWSVSLSLLGLETDMADRSNDVALYVQTLLLRARIAGRLSQKEMARSDLHRAAEAMTHLQDEAYRERAEADRLGVEGVLAASAADAVPLLGKAIDFHRVKGRHMLLPDLLLQRGRALIEVGDREAAAADFEAGIKELEVQRNSIAPGEERWGMFAAADELFSEAMALALARNDPRTAFAYAERARARELLEALDEPSTGKPPSVSDALIIEYATLPARLVIFVADGERVHAVQADLTRGVLSSEVDHLRQSSSLHDEEQFKRSAAVLYSQLIAPINDVLGSDRRLVFVPDAALRGVPFAALIDGSGTYLVERYTIVVAPSAAVFQRVAGRPRLSGRNPHLLVVAGPGGSEGALDSLRAAGQEASAVAAQYTRVMRMSPNESDDVAFVTQARNADVIHFIGHAVAGQQPALVTARRSESGGRLDVTEVARMHLRQTRVVVLAACNTGRGTERDGEGNISIARAFIAAGVPSVVATLWPIEDAPAAEFFPRLHRYLAEGVPPAEALRSVQIDAIRRRDAPAMWAAVQVIGS